MKRGRAGERWWGAKGGRGVVQVAKVPAGWRQTPQYSQRLAGAWVGVWRWVPSVGEVNEEAGGLESGERVQERREWDGDGAPCGAPVVIRAMVGSDSWVGGHSL